ncbi:MAG: biotin--[acetyl-CoA-carboxylase] ligase [Cyclonatronaceae bacterium]
MKKPLISRARPQQTRLAGCIDLERFLRERQSRRIAGNIWAFNRLPSTNTLLKTMPPHTAPEGLLCISRHQYSGRGQGQRRWEAEDGHALTFSIYLLPPASGCDRLQLLLQAAALSVLQSLKACFAINGVLKWPNDVLVGGKKICGILAESSFVGNKIERFVLGIGLNTNGRLPAAVAQDSINIEQIVQRPADHTELLLSLVKHLDHNYQRWLENDMQLVTDINTHHRGYGRRVALHTGAGLHPDYVKFLGLDMFGYPIFLDDFDDIKRFKSDDIRFHPVE